MRGPGDCCRLLAPIYLFHRARGTWICCSTGLPIPWLVLVGALTGDWTRNLSVSGRYSNLLSYWARTAIPLLIAEVPNGTAGKFSPKVAQPRGPDPLCAPALLLPPCCVDWKSQATAMKTRYLFLYLALVKASVFFGRGTSSVQLVPAPCSPGDSVEACAAGCPPASASARRKAAVDRLATHGSEVQRG